jgi:hypothetical protein
MNSFGTRQHAKRNLILGEVACNMDRNNETEPLKYLATQAAILRQDILNIWTESWNIGTGCLEY